MSQFRPMNACFERCDTIRAAHLLWEDFLKERTDLSARDVKYKMAFYMWLQRNELDTIEAKDANGDFGLGLKFIPRGAEAKSITNAS